MRRLLANANDLVASWVAKRVGCGGFSAGYQALGMVRENHLIGGVVWDSWNGASMQLHAAGEPGWLTLTFVRETFFYPFEICGVRKLISLAASGNVKSTRLLQHLGFVCEATLHDAHPDGALLVYTMTPAQCRWLGRRSLGKKLSTAS